jgi:hypothetical protein
MGLFLFYPFAKGRLRGVLLTKRKIPLVFSLFKKGDKMKPGFTFGGILRIMEPAISAPR